MKKMEISQMENLQGGGCGARADKAIAWFGMVAGVVSMLGPIGLAIGGPTALGMGIAGLVCSYR